MVVQSLLTHSPVFLFGATLLLGAACLAGRAWQALWRRGHRR